MAVLVRDKLTLNARKDGLEMIQNIFVLYHR